MSLIEKIKQDQFQARKDRDPVVSSLLSTLYSEIVMVGKNAGNRDTTDDEAIKVIQKFLKGVNETIAFLKAANTDVTVSLAVAEKEKTVLEAYLPKMASAEDVTAYLRELKQQGTDLSNMGMVMKELKAKFGNALDGKQASELIRNFKE